MDPEHGMWVVHTTIYDLEQRMWAVHEVDECIAAGVRMHGLFDVYRWTADGLDGCMNVKTAESQCRPEDKAMLVRKINKRGGFERLDGAIARFRLQMKAELQEALSQNKEEFTQSC